MASGVAVQKAIEDKKKPFKLWQRIQTEDNRREKMKKKRHLNYLQVGSNPNWHLLRPLKRKIKQNRV